MNDLNDLDEQILSETTADLNGWRDSITARIHRLEQIREGIDAALDNFPAPEWTAPDSPVTGMSFAFRAPRQEWNAEVAQVVAGEEPVPSPAPSPATVKKPTRRPKAVAPDYVRAASIYLNAKASGRSPRQAMADYFGLPISTVKNWPARLRELGLIDPDDNPGRTLITSARPVSQPDTGITVIELLTTPPTPNDVSIVAGRPVLMCDECDYEAAGDRAMDINRHTMTDHHRRATPAERTPVPTTGKVSAA